FAATSGSSVATAATIGTVSSPNIDRYGYPPRLFLDTIAAGGTLGILIPPSINMVLYGSLSESSVSKLYLAAMIPGAITALLFSLLILVLCMLFPHLSPRHPAHAWATRLRELVHLIPMLVLFLLVVGSIYAGLATPTEASALGVMGAFALVAMRRRLSVQLLLRAFEGTVRTTSMIMLIVIAAFFLIFVMSTIGLTDKAVEIVAGLTWDPLTIMLALILLYLVLGCFVETLTLMVATTPLVVPIILQLGYDPIWFG